MAVRSARRFRAVLVWSAVAAALLVPLAAASASPLLAWREPIYIVAGFAGIIGMALMLIQPLLIAGYLPGISRTLGRRVHRWIGGCLALALIIHVAGLWITSPPDVVDALLFTSPTPFSAWGVIAMWAVLATTLLALWRKRLRLGPRIWRRIHLSFVVVIVTGTVVHAVLIEGTMEEITKLVLCALVLAAALRVVTRFGRLALRSTPRASQSATSKGRAEMEKSGDGRPGRT
ncbi:ferric reductase-like transmembrane domain-containing protein [Roseobacter sp.]|uniref:ferric reductase-like transmembrane domain-containing protein n=1 Tax=Roseobacter sp. TaxID=1907202 RepID=UPI00296663B0|nr:ferric reductase-like transmembrane domain-containing protein [Roseobacter sp.]